MYNLPYDFVARIDLNVSSSRSILEEVMTLQFDSAAKTVVILIVLKSLTKKVHNNNNFDSSKNKNFKDEKGTHE